MSSFHNKEMCFWMKVVQYQHVYEYDENIVLLVYIVNNHNQVCRNCIHPIVLDIDDVGIVVFWTF
jgi:hypothetical protein